MLRTQFLLFNGPQAKPVTLEQCAALLKNGTAYIGAMKDYYAAYIPDTTLEVVSLNLESPPFNAPEALKAM